MHEPDRTELAGLVTRVRALIEATVASAPSPEAIAAACEAVERAVGALGRFVPTPRPPRYPARADLSDPTTLMPYDPVVGPLSPLAPPILFRWEDGKAIGRVRFGPAYEGPPGCVHGGIIAAGFDQVFNVANVMSGIVGPTAQLTVRYRRPTPLAADVVFEGWQERTEGRRIHTAGRLRNGDVVTAEAEGVFVQLPAEQVMKMLERP
jgi:acyl-coenzyme A thioesterase PaaI-like protein